MRYVKPTRDLTRGDRVIVSPGIVRTVERIGRTAYVNHHGETLLTVFYAEGNTPEWSDGNSAAPGSPWDVIDDGPCLVCGAYSGDHDDGCMVAPTA